MINNYFKTTIFLAALTSLLVLLGYFIGGSTVALIFFGISIIFNLGIYWFSSSLALKMARAREVSVDELPFVKNALLELCSKMNIPLPKVYVSDQMQPNAFATGRNPANSAICFTRGILQALNEEELTGVMAHELAHIKNRDTLISTIAAVIAGGVSALAEIAFWFGGGDENGNPLVGLLTWIFAPIAATLIQLAISRSREFAADATAARYTGNPSGLSNALLKLEEYGKQIPMKTNPATASLYISNPFKGRNRMDWFSTHPSTEKRISKIMSLQLKG